MFVTSVCFFTACQSTTEEEIVIGKGGNLNELIQPSQQESSDNISPQASDDISTQTNDALYGMLEAPEHWNYESTALNGKLNIVADADILLPSVSQLPAATASLSEFTQDDLNRIAQICGVPDEAVWTEHIYMTKERIEQMILDNKALIAQGTDDGADDTCLQLMVMLEAQMDTLPILTSSFRRDWKLSL